MELLVRLADLLCLHIVVNFGQNLVEICWSVQVAARDSFLVMSDHLIDTIDSRIKDVTIQCETVRRTGRIRWNSATETVQVYHLITIVEL